MFVGSPRETLNQPGEVADHNPLVRKVIDRENHQESKSMAAKKAAAIKDKYSKTQILADISESTGLSRKEVGAVLEELGILVERHIKKRGCGEFTLPGLLKIVTRKKPAQKAKKGVPNPFKPGELMDVPAKPASIQVKVRPLKKLKEYATS
ncbi:HU family DNA-binding protein [Endozoicomonas numazuensis]|nr:HU family DNA-binding protein [Endozoicomonas numazuensis]